MRKLFLAVLCQLILIPAFAHTSESGTVQTQGQPANMMVTTTDSLEGYKIKEYKGIVRGITVRQPTMKEGLSAKLEHFKGGHIGAYVTMCETARQQAYDLCLDRARELGANAIVGMRYDTSSFDHDDNVETEVACYGTAVIIERDTKVAANKTDLL